MRFAFLAFCGLGLVGCGEDGDLLGGQSGEPLEIYVPDYAPGSCWTEPSFHLVIDSELHLSIQRAQILSMPIVEDSSAGAWRMELENGSLVEGTVLARGTDWGVAKMVAMYSDRRAAFDADIDLMPHRTEYQFGGHSLVVKPNVQIFDDYVRGCDPTSNTSFESLRGTAQCWTPGISGQGLSGGSGASGGLSIPGRRPGLSSSLDSCNQLINAAVRW